MSSEILIPITGLIAAVGVWFARKRTQAGQGAMTQPPSSAAPIPSVQAPQPKPLPKNIPLTVVQVQDLAQRTVSAFGFLCSARELVATAEIESSFRPWVYRNEKRANGTVWDTSYGLMQTLLGTAQDMYSRGYRGAGVPTKEMLSTPEVSMYFGAAYKDWLMRTYKGKSPEWYVRAYNGGPGWEKTAGGTGNTAVYYSRYQKAMRNIYGVA